MKRNKWLLGIGGFIAITIMISLDLYKSHQEEKPPLPLLMVGEKEVNAIIGPFTWNSEEMNQKERDELLEGMVGTPVNPLQNLTIHFPEEPPSQVEVYFADINFMNLGRDMNIMGGDFHNGQKVKISNEVGPLIFTIEAKWDGKRKAKYYALIEREQVVSYQQLLSEYDSSYSVFALYHPDQTDPFIDSPLISDLFPISKLDGSDDPKSFQHQYPELNIRELPTYLLFDDEKLVIQANHEDELIRFFEEVFEPVTETFGGAIFGLNHEKKIVNVYNWKYFYYEDIDSLKIGQQIKADVTFNHLTDPTQTETHYINIMEEPPGIFQEDSYKAKGPNHYTLVAFGDNFLSNQIEEDQEIANYVDIIIKETSYEGSQVIGHAFVLFDDKGPVLVGDYLVDILQYLKEQKY